jgi:hypothetical protein
MGLLLFCNYVYKSLLCFHEMNISGVIQEFRLLCLFVSFSGKL